MTRIKKAVVYLVVLLFTVCLSVSIAACTENGQKTESGKRAVSDYEESSTFGLYTRLAFVVDSGNGQVWVSVKNTFTFLPSTVIVELELYNSETYKESYTEMTLADSKYTADLDQGETLKAMASTNGRQSYWKARMRYKIDNADWEETVSETMLFDADGTRKEITSTTVSDDKEYLISDFISADAENIVVSLPYVCNESCLDDPAHIHMHTRETLLSIESDEEVNAIKDVFGDLKLDAFDIDSKPSNVKNRFYVVLDAMYPFSVNLSFADGSSVLIGSSNFKRDIENLGANLAVKYVYIENGEKVFRYFTATVSEETEQVLLELLTNIYKNHRGE